ncbi:MAG: hypothetical protein ACRESW_01825, partial [Nevskiales bacterium]
MNKFQIWGRATSTGAPTESSTATLGAATGEATKCQNNNPGAYTCPSSSTTPPTTTDGPGPDETTTTTTTTSWSGCSYVEQTNACGASDNKSLWTPRGTKTVTTTSTVSTLATSAEITDAKSTCRTDAMSCTALDFPATCSDGTYQQCRCDTPIFAECGGAGTQRYQVRGNYTETTAKITDGDRPAPTGPFMADEWARFLSERGVPLPGAVAPPGGEVPRTQVTTYAIDVFNAQQHPDFSGLLFNIAHVGGGKYFQAKNENQLRDALLKIFSEVQSVNSAFSSASLPVNATNRAQNENQVFIGVFRPDRTKEPQWFGNLKRYQLVANGTRIDLGDSNGATAINPLTGFLAECAVSFWTTASGTYWQSVITDNPPAVSNCGAVANSAHSDLPDGPYVEKGAVAEVLRKGNDPNATPGGDGNYVLSRNMKTRTAATAAGELLPNFSFPVSTLPDIDRDADADVDADDATLKTTRATLIENFIKGQDRNDDDLDGGATTTGRTEPRSTIHGDVIHSRPQPVNYGDADGNPANGINPGVVIYYGANDGTFRAVKAATGQELWSFVAPEHFGKFDRYTSNAPNIKYFDPEGDDPPGTEPKDYFFDGSTGVRQTANNSQVWIFPTMRRGGRRIYAFDVTSTSAPMLPRYLWS